MSANDQSELSAVQKALDGIKDQVREQAEKALAEAQKGVKLADEQKSRVDEMLTKYNEQQALLTDALQKLARRGSEPDRVKTYGEQVAESDGYKSYQAGSRVFTVSIKRDAEMEQKTVTSANAGALIRPRYETEPVALPRRRFTIRDLLNVIRTADSSVDYPRQTTRTNAAAPVAEGAKKPYSDYVWSGATAPIRTIAHLAKLTRQAMDDAPRLVAEVDSEMRYGLGLAEEAQLLNGDGTGQNINGLVTQATAYVAPITVASPTRIDMLRLGMLQASLGLFPADGIVISEADWAGIELTKTSDGAYLFANPQGSVNARLWGLPVVATPAMATDKFLVGNFQIGATLYDRMGVEVLISTENATDFEDNLATMRCEERIGLAVKRPGSFIYGDFGLVA